MKSTSKLLLFVTLGCLLFVAACQQAPEPQKIGVFASTDHGLLELTAYGEQNSMTNYSFGKTGDMPRVSKIAAFYVNMPDVTITTSKVFWVTELKKDFDEASHSSLSLSMEAGKNNNVYTLTSPDLNGKKNGFALLKIGMPPGIADRMYVIQVSD